MEPIRRHAGLTVRLTDGEREILDRAALLEGRDRSQFMRFHALEVARVKLGILPPVAVGAANGEAR